MKAVYDFIIEPVGERYTNTKKSKDGDLILKKNDPKDVYFKMEFAKKNYDILTIKNKLNKSKLKKFLFKNFAKQLLNNIN